MAATDAKTELSCLAVLHHGPLFGYCRRRLGGDAEAEDALQEVFLRAYRYFGSLDRNRDPRKWLFGIAHNVCVEQARSRARLTVLEELPETDDGGATTAALEKLAREEHLELVRRELDRLPDRTRRILELRFFGQLSSADIARLEGMNEGAVRVALHRGLEGLRARLAPGGGKEQQP